MTESKHRAGQGERDHFVACLREVRAARGHLVDARADGVRSQEKQALRADLLVALERYALAIVELGVPVPGRLRREIDLYRRLEQPH